MDAMPTCSGCHKPLPANAPQGLCPECLLKAGLGTGVDIGPDTQSQPFGRLEGRWPAGNQPPKGRSLLLELMLAGFQKRRTGSWCSSVKMHRSWCVIAAAALALFWAQMAPAQTHTVIKHFGIPSKVTGLNPQAPLVQGPDGTL